MCYRFPFVACAVLVLLSGCANPAPSPALPRSVAPRISTQVYPRIGLIALFRNDATVSSASSFFAIPKGGTVELPGLAPALTEKISAELRQAGYHVTTLSVSTDQYWQASAKILDQSTYANARLTVQSLVKEGAIDVSNIDAVLLVGPTEFYHNHSFLSQKGKLVALHTLGTKPGELSANLTMHAFAIKASTMEGCGGGKAAGPPASRHPQILRPPRCPRSGAESGSRSLDSARVGEDMRPAGRFIEVKDRRIARSC